MSAKLLRFQCLFTPAQLDRLCRLKVKSGVPVTEQVRRAVEAWLKKQGA